MSTNTINAQLCSKMFLAGAKSLEARKDWINELNVFPVPDGDTGTNMTMTAMSAVNEINNLEDDAPMSAVAKAMSSGSLRGARGNSGVILSQILRGFCKVVRDHDEVNTEIICSAFQKAVETAYRAVMKPKEGTILTVARAFSEKASELFENDPTITMEMLLCGSVNYAREILMKTPEMLPVLKEAGVVDSGGAGLIQILQGAFDVYCGKEIDLSETVEITNPEQKPATRFAYRLGLRVVSRTAVDDKTRTNLSAYLDMIGDNISMKEDGNTLTIAVNTDDPGRVITYVLPIGPIYDVCVENLLGEEEAMMEGAELSEDPGPKKDVGFVTVSVGAGLKKIFEDLGADVIISGGQTMNPSTEDVLNAIHKVNADTVFVFPNNKNIILAASQAKELCEDKNVIVVPTRSIPQGITAMISYVPENTPEENEQLMNEEIAGVHTAELTYAVRDTHIEDKEIHQGDIMGVGDHGILAVGKEIEQTALDSIAEMMDDDSELIVIYYGADTNADDAKALADKVRQKYPDCEVELNEGGQPIYYYIISVE